MAKLNQLFQLKSVFNMEGNMGRRRQISAFVVTGNKNGSAGIALGKAAEAKVALRKAKNRAGQKLLYIEIFNNHTGRFVSAFCVYISLRRINSTSCVHACACARACVCVYLLELIILSDT
jgi:ribosomal protein S5